MDRSVEARPQMRGEFVDDVRTAVVLDRMRRVEAQSVQAERVNPVFGVLNDEVANGTRVGPVEIDRLAPRRPMSIGEKVRRVGREVIPLRSKMIVDHVEQHGDAASVRRFDEGLEILWPPIGRVGGVGVDPVVAPAPAAAEVANRHDLDRGRAEFDEVIELIGRPGERSGWREGADMQLIEHDVVPGPARPAVAPDIRLVVDRLAWPVHVPGLKAGRWVRNAHPVGELEAIERSRAHPFDEDLEEAAVLPLHRDRRASAVEREAHPLLGRRPEPKADPALLERRAMRPSSCALIHGRPPSAISVSNGRKPSSAATVPRLGRSCMRRLAAFRQHQASAGRYLMMSADNSRRDCGQLENAALSRSCCDTTSLWRSNASGDRARARRP